MGPGVALETLAPAAVPADLRREADALSHALQPAIQAHQMEAPVVSAQRLSLSLGAGRCFDAHSGQLHWAALAPVVQLATVLARYPAQVVWIVGRGADAGDPYSLAERRAASVAAVLRRHGIPRARSRFITAPAAGRAPVIEVVVVPLLTGRVPAAYMPPA
ncbi:MAG TPA: hypothetical protein VFQ88_13395 [Nevskiaceae bacterium]|nr:hypothetical protein [Nevskiaceae bacterium]